MESKRIFNQAKMNRDIDDRLLPEGSYRYANNVNIGESEGGDIGAVENLKGNHIVGEDVIGGTTIGVVRDPNNDRVYFFNKGVEFDTIYEYDESLGTVVPILKDSVDRDLVKPTCVPTFTTFINEPDGDDNNRPTPSFSYKMPVEGCMDSTATNYNPAATYTDTTVCEFQPAGCNDPAASNYIPGSDGSVACTYPPTGVPFTFASTGPACSLIPASGSTDMLSDGYITVATGTIQSITPNTQAENTGSSLITGITFSVNVTGTIPTGQNFLNEGTPFDVTGDVECSQSGTVAPEKFRWGFASGGATGVGTQVHGDMDVETIEGEVYTPVGASMVTINDPATMQWATLPTIQSVTGLPAGVTLTAVSGTVGASTAVNVSFTGSYTVTKDEFATITWQGGTITAIQMGVAVNYESTNFHVSSVPGTGTSNVFNRSGTTASIFGELIQLNEFGLISGFGNVLNVNFTVTPFVESGGNVTQTIDTGAITIPPNDHIHNVNYQWGVDATIDTTWNILINTVEISLGGTVTGTTGLITGSPSPALTRSGSGGGTP